MKILLIHNYWEWRYFPILAKVIQWGTPKEYRGQLVANHSAFLLDGIVCEMRGASFLWLLRKQLGFKVSYAPNAGCGYKETPFKEWGRKHNRYVWEFEPTVEVQPVTIDFFYGFFDLPQIGLMILRKEYLKTGNTWNGEDGVCKTWAGVVCSELVALILKLKKPFTYWPERLRNVPELKYLREYKTERR